MMKEEADTLRNNISFLTDTLITKYSDILDDALPSLKNDYNQLKQQIKGEKEENDLLNRELLNIKKEQMMALKRIQVCRQAITKLELALGVKPKVDENNSSLMNASPEGGTPINATQAVLKEINN